MDEIKDEVKDEVKEEQEESKPRTHEDHLIAFNKDLNEILSKGYPIPAVLTVLESAIFELRMLAWTMQMQAEERRRQNEKHIEIPHMKIPTNKK